jgi:hypothetical protein
VTRDDHIGRCDGVCAHVTTFALVG